MYEFDKIEEITESLKQYVNTNYEIIKLEATERTSVIGSSFVSGLIVGLTAFLFVFTLSIGMGFYLSALLGDSYSGFVIIAAFYFALAIVILIVRKRFIETPLRDKIIRKILEKKDI
ncbi:MAG: hypothetical protein GZ091_14800 [Paludibacter sp.]|nr:hypothetical protein [Paludibacter sp.]